MYMFALLQIWNLFCDIT